MAKNKVVALMYLAAMMAYFGLAALVLDVFSASVVSLPPWLQGGIFIVTLIPPFIVSGKVMNTWHGQPENGR